MNIFTKAAAVAMTAVTLASSVGFASPSICKEPHVHVSGIQYGHECGRVRDVAYSAWIFTGSWGVFYDSYYEENYMRTRSVVCDYCGKAFSSSIEHKTVKYWFGNYSSTKYW